MKKRLLAALLACCMCLSIGACGKKEEEVSGGSEFKDGKFTETVKITVEVYDRGNDGGSDPTNNMYTDYIKKGMLDTYNVEVEFVAVSRWEEVQQINNLLAGGTAPDICLTYDYPTIQTYAGMDGVLELNQYLEQYKDKLPNLYNWLGDTNIYWDKDPNTGELWAIEGKRADIKRINTFVRQDWLDKLGMKAPICSPSTWTATRLCVLHTLRFGTARSKLCGSQAVL